MSNRVFSLLLILYNKIDMVNNETWRIKSTTCQKPSGNMSRRENEKMEISHKKESEKAKQGYTK